MIIMNVVALMVNGETLINFLIRTINSQIVCKVKVYPTPTFKDDDKIKLELYVNYTAIKVVMAIETCDSIRDTRTFKSLV